MLIVWILGFIIVLFGFVVFFGAPYVPSKKHDLAVAFDTLYPLGSEDVLVDIGSGDGVVLREVAQRGARAVGYELNPALVAISWLLCRHWPMIEIRLANFWHVKLPPDTTIVYVFGESRDIAKMSQKIAREASQLARPLMLISYGFRVPGKTPVRQEGAHYLYEYKPAPGPLQSEEA